MFAVLYIAIAASADTCGSGDIARTVGDFQGCTYQQTGNVACFSSGGFNSSRYTPNLECTIALCQDVKYYYNGFSIEYEKSCNSDALIFAGIKFCGYGDTPSVKDDGWTGTPQNDDMTPSSWLGQLSRNSIIQFKTDDSDEYQGFELCFTPDVDDDVVIPDLPPPPPPSPVKSDDTETIGIIVGVTIGAFFLVAGIGFYVMGSRQQKKNTALNLGKLVF